MRAAVIALMCVMVTAVAEAHVTVWPIESRAGTSERYTVRVPTEGQVATTSVELDIPAGVTVTGPLVTGGFTYEITRDCDRIAGIVWRQEIKAGEIAEFVFFARNPPTPGPVAWKVRQRFADGTSADWVGVEGDRRPASVTKIAAALAR